MKRELFKQALGFVSDRHIAEAARPPKKKHTLGWLGGIAAALAVVILLLNIFSPFAVRADAVSTPKYPKYKWQYRGDEMNETMDALNSYFAESMRACLSGAGEENIAFSPVNLYMALAMTAELTAGETQSQILSLLNAPELSALRAQANTMWNACYMDDGDQTLLANALWLEEGLPYKQAVMDTLAKSYYASVYKGDLGSDEINKAIAQWLNQQTRGFLEQETGQVRLSQETILALYSTIYYRAMWTESSEFSSRENTAGVFTSTKGRQTVTYMNKKLWQSNYYWTEDCGAVALGLKDGSSMWLILPDEGKTPEDLLCSGSYLAMLQGGYDYADSKYMKINLKVPKFDIRATTVLDECLKSMGITDVFSPGKADFSPGIEDTTVFLTGVNQSTRVAIDEKGVTAASYIELPGAGAAMPPDEIMDFTLDRPFLFVITNRYGVPLFAGIVNCL